MRARQTVSLTAALFALLAAPGAMAQGIPSTDEIIWPESGAFAGYPPTPSDGRVWRFSAFGALHHDDNLFRLPGSANVAAITGSNERSDTVRRLGVGIRADIPVSLQRFTVEAEVDQNDFDHYDQLDYVGHRLSGLWRWRVGSLWAGDVGAGTRKVLGGYGDIQAGGRNLVTENRAFASAGYMFTPRWRLRGGLDVNDIEHSSAARQALESRSHSTTLGIDYVTPASNSIGVQVRYTTGDTPSQTLGATVVNNDYDQVETSLVGHWVPTGKTTVDGRIGYARRSHDQISGRDFNGVTGRVSANWTATGKTLFNIAVWRDIQSYQTVLSGPVSPSMSPAPTLPQSTPAQPGFASTRGTLLPGELVSSRDSILDPAVAPTDTVAESVQGYVIARGISVGPAWAPTEKIVLQARLLHEKLDYRGDPGVPLGLNARRDDSFRGMNFAVGYTPIRALLLAVAYQTGKRTSSLAGRDYDFDTLTLSGRFTF